MGKISPDRSRRTPSPDSTLQASGSAGKVTRTSEKKSAKTRKPKRGRPPSSPTPPPMRPFDRSGDESGSFSKVSISSDETQFAPVEQDQQTTIDTPCRQTSTCTSNLLYVHTPDVELTTTIPIKSKRITFSESTMSSHDDGNSRSVRKTSHDDSNSRSIRKTSQDNSNTRSIRKTSGGIIGLKRWQSFSLAKKQKAAGGVDLSHQFLERFSQHAERRHAETALRTESPSFHSLFDSEADKYEKYVISPEGNAIFAWLTILTLAVVYNLWTCIGREAFTDVTLGYESAWITTDILADAIYLADIGVQMRTGYIRKGLLVSETRLLFNHYTRTIKFAVDVTSLLPLDLIQLFIGMHPLLRFPRFLKVYRTYQFMYFVGIKSVRPNLWRFIILLHHLILGAHYCAAFYFIISRSENFAGEWSYPIPVGEYAAGSRKYLASLNWATLTLTTIGTKTSPQNNTE